MPGQARDDPQQEDLGEAVDHVGGLRGVGRDEAGEGRLCRCHETGDQGPVHQGDVAPPPGDHNPEPQHPLDGGLKRGRTAGRSLLLSALVETCLERAVHCPCGSGG